MLKQRLIYGVLGVILAIAVITLCPVYIIGICVGMISLIALGEFYNVTGLLEKKSPAIILGFIFCALSTAVVILKSFAATEYLIYSIVAFVFLLMVCMVLCHNKCSFSDASVTFLGTVYITVFFLHILLVRQLEYGKILIWILFISAWSTDTFAYFCGKAMGKHKLCPAISPKKTVEGAIGGVIGCLILVCLYVFVIGRINNLNVNYLSTAILAVLSSAFSQLGDLAASCIKREHNVKDYGNLIPGHGGILDRFDSTLLIAPLVYYLLATFPVLGGTL